MKDAILLNNFTEDDDGDSEVTEFLTKTRKAIPDSKTTMTVASVAQLSQRRAQNPIRNALVSIFVILCFIVHFRSTSWWPILQACCIFSDLAKETPFYVTKVKTKKEVKNVDILAPREALFVL